MHLKISLKRQRKEKTVGLGLGKIRSRSNCGRSSCLRLASSHVYTETCTHMLTHTICGPCREDKKALSVDVTDFQSGEWHLLLSL